MEQEEIGQRVLARIGPSRTHREVADAIGMTPDGFSRALNGKRAFSSIELAKAAELLNVDVHWLITGQEDPNRIRVAARHQFDHESGKHSVPGREDDDTVLADVTLAYRQAYPNADHPSADLPESVMGVRDALGPDFVGSFADHIERHLDVDVVRVPGLTTDYSFTQGGRHVIAGCPGELVSQQLVSRARARPPGAAPPRGRENGIRSGAGGKLVRGRTPPS